MLKKLIKHEIKTIWRFLAMAAVFLVCLTLVGVVGIHILHPEAVQYPDGYPPPGNFTIYNSSEGGSVSISGGTLTALIASLYIMAYIAGAFLLTAGTYIYLWMHFHNTMYGHQGYLTNTLPTTPAKLILSKLITAVSWMFISIAMLIGSIWSLNAAVRSASGIPQPQHEYIFTELINNGVPIITTFVLIVLLTITAIIMAVLMMYGSSALGQLAKRNRGFTAIVYYVAMAMIINVVSTVALAISARSVNMQNGVFYDGTTYKNSQLEYYEFISYMYSIINWNFFAFLIMIVAGAVILYYITHHITSKKLNLE